MDGYGAIRFCSDRMITSSRISCSLGACFLGFALSTLSLQYIYTRWSLSACSCSLHTLSPSPDLNKTSLASLSPHCSSACSCSLHTLSPSPDLNKTLLASLSSHCWSKSRQDPSTGKGRRLNAVAVDEEGNPLLAQLFSFTQRWRGRASDPFFLAAVHSVGRSASGHPLSHTPRTLRYNLLIPHALL